MNLLQINRGAKHFGTRVLFDSATFAVNAGEHVGVIGPNGAGKTTLFKIIAGQETLDSGEITRANGLRLGYLEQEAEWSLSEIAEVFLEKSCTKPIWDLKRLGRSLGLTQDHFSQPLKNLSGGYRMRMKLLYLIGLEPDLMLLDEPTNFLDLETVLALEGFLQDFGGAFLLISHDREFLKRTTEYTLEIEAGDITKFPGNIDDYFEQKAQLQQILQAQAANQESKRKHIQDFVDRFRAKATKAKQAQSRMKQLDKMETIELKKLPVRARIRIPAPIHTGRDTFQVENASLGYGSNQILSHVNLRAERGTHLGVVGYNGAGKSTLLKSLAGEIPLLSGEVKLGYQVSLAYFSQHSADQLKMEDTVLDSLQKAAHRELLGQDILNMAGSLLFSGDDIHKKVKVLSGGEKSRVALGQILLKKCPLPLLDEPTNHLDFETIEALTEALHEYEGTCVVVSHDRGFIGRVATKILEIRDGRVELYPGSYDEYVWSLQRGALSERGPGDAGSGAGGRGSGAGSGAGAGSGDGSGAGGGSQAAKFNFKDASKQIQGAIKEAQRKIQKCEELLHQKEKERDRLTHELLSVQGAQAAALAKELGLCGQEIQRLEDDILKHMETQELKERELEALRARS